MDLEVSQTETTLYKQASRLTISDPLSSVHVAGRKNPSPDCSVADGTRRCSARAKGKANREPKKKKKNCTQTVNELRYRGGQPSPPPPPPQPIRHVGSRVKHVPLHAYHAFR